MKTKKPGRKRVQPDKAIFETLYYNPTMTAKDLAETYGVSTWTIYHWAWKLRKEQKNG